MAGDPASLSPAEVAAQLQAAEQLRGDLMRSSAEVSAATGRLTQLAQQSTALLQRLSDARAAEAAATARSAREQKRLSTLTAEVVAAQDSIGHWAHDTYVRGNGSLEDLAATVQVLTSRSPGSAVNSVGLLEYLADQRTRSFEHLVALTSAQRDAAKAAAVASTHAREAAAKAVAAKADLDVAVRAQQGALDGFRLAEAAQVSRANTLRGRLLGLSGADALTADRRLAEALGGGLRMPAGVAVAGTCRADDASYPNGQLPPSALCPVYSAPGEFLREGSARAFNALSKAYRRDTGRPLCVTDAYRPYAEQMAVYKKTPNLAAKPGTSKHGLGMAVDLCGGVQSFGSPAHLWMKQNAPLYGWFHPAWAEPGGPMPEPWHWEFAS